ncbi:MAG TPA: 3'(2'),5'-bisphosphate nucleotidase CysQ [Hyphomicrobiaceae bacterium]|nr:3'(2'),5'-bisphosphate nucleotidase CysQ [Hyphomicrobiaceae bacterium]
MHANEIARLADGLLSVALAAGRVQMAHFAAGVAVSIKDDQSPVTAADHESEEVILEGLARLAPGVAVIAEEEVTAGRIPGIAGAFFLVDPLDGTKGFIKGRREFTVNVGLIEERWPVFGLIYAPALSELYVTLGPDSAAMAHIEPAAEARSLADCALRPIRTRVPDPNAISALTSQTHLNQATMQFLEGYNVIERRAIASSLKFGLLAKGDADLYPRIGPTSEWDTAAGHAILAAAGGSVTRLDGTPLFYGNAERRFENPDFVAWGRGPLPRQAKD